MPIVFDQIRGLADSKHSGIAGSVAEMVGIDIHSTPGLTKIQQALAKDSGATVDAFVRIAITASDGSTLWFSYTTGKIWLRTTGGAWTLEHTTTPAAGISTVNSLPSRATISVWAAADCIAAITGSRSSGLRLRGADSAYDPTAAHGVGTVAAWIGPTCA